MNKEQETLSNSKNRNWLYTLLAVVLLISNKDSSYAKTIVNYFENLGYNVMTNSPFSGSIVPLKYINNTEVHSVMIELNRDLYMNGDFINIRKVLKLNKEINDLFNF